MPVDHIRYDVLTQMALRGVVRTVLVDVAQKGLPGEHHFKVTFSTTAPGVRLSERMRAQYPQDMTIVLQHQFWDLTVTDQGFEVGLSFGGAPERVAVPFDAVTAFYDPAAQFGFQFETLEAATTIEAGGTGSAGKSTAPQPRPAAGRKPPEALPTALPVARGADPADSDADAGTGGEVVRLDRFRKNKP